MQQRRSEKEIKRLLKETKTMKNSDAARHIGISIGTFYKWKQLNAKVAPKVDSKPKSTKKLEAIVKGLEAYITRLKKEI